MNSLKTTVKNRSMGPGLIGDDLSPWVVVLGGGGLSCMWNVFTDR